MHHMNEMIERLKKADGDPEAEYEALLALHRAAWAGEVDRNDFNNTLEPALRHSECKLWGAVSELAGAYGQREEDGTPCYAQMLDYLHYPHIERLYGGQSWGSHEETFEEVDQLFRKSFEGPSIRLEHEALQAMDRALRNGTITKADALFLAGNLRENNRSSNIYEVYTGINILVMGHEIGIADDPDFATSPITDRIISSSYGGHGSDFDYYIDEGYLDSL